MGKSNRIKEWRERRGLTLEQLSEISMISVSYLSRMERDGRNVSLKNLAKIGEALRVSASDLVGAKAQSIPLGGFIGASAEIFPAGSQGDGGCAPMIEAPVSAPKDAVAFEVVGDNMLPRFDPGEILICWQRGDTRDIVDGCEAAVMTEDGHRYLKKLRRVGEELFDLESHNASPIRNVRLEWILKVGATVRAGEWRRVLPEKQSATRKKNTKQAWPERLVESECAKMEAELGRFKADTAFYSYTDSRHGKV